MGRYRKKPIVIEATQWFKNGDHPEDHDPIGIENPSIMTRDKYHDYLSTEGKVVRRFNHPITPGHKMCDKCCKLMREHGWIDTLEGGNDGAQVVCPGDFIITGIQGEHYPCKPDIFVATYEEVSP